VGIDWMVGICTSVNYVKFLTHFYTQKLTHPHAKKSPIKMVVIY
jgi:hypothetical protein